MEAGLLEIVLSVNRSCIGDAYFSLYIPIHPGRKVREECPMGKCPDTVPGLPGFPTVTK